MRVFSLVIALSMAVPSAGSTQSMSKGASLPGGEAIGRLMVAGRSMCTGALVASDLVLTAAHCLYSPKTGRKVDPRKIEFQAGLRSGKAKATRTVKNTVQHPKYRHNVGNAQVGYDLALLKLRKPIPASIAKPVAISTGRSSEGLLGVVSYTIGNQNDPRMMFPCQVLARQNETMVMNCKVNFGASGAPVLSIQKGEPPELVSVISAKAAMGGRDVSVGTTLSVSTLQKLLSEG